MTDYTRLITQGLWSNNPALVQLLGLCPLLAVSNNLVNALGMGFATIWVLMGSNIAIAAIARFCTAGYSAAVFCDGHCRIYHQCRIITASL